MKKLLVGLLLALVLVPAAVTGHGLTRPLFWSAEIGNNLPMAPISAVLVAPHGVATRKPPVHFVVA